MKSYHPDDPKLVANWFDPYNLKHLRAWREMEEHGQWPRWFVDLMDEEGIKPHQNWSIVIQAKMAEKWIESKLGLVRRSVNQFGKREVK